jgi:hypothetical protein
MNILLRTPFIVASIALFLLVCSSGWSYGTTTVILDGHVYVITRDKKGNQIKTPCAGQVAAFRNREANPSHKVSTDTSREDGSYNNLRAEDIGDKVTDLWVTMDPLQKELFADPVEAVLPLNSRPDPTKVTAPDLLAKRFSRATAANNVIEGAWYSAAVIETQGVLRYLGLLDKLGAQDAAQTYVGEVAVAQNLKEGENGRQFFSEINNKLKIFNEAHPQVAEAVIGVAESIGIKVTHHKTGRNLLANE